MTCDGDTTSPCTGDCPAVLSAPPARRGSRSPARSDAQDAQEQRARKHESRIPAHAAGVRLSPFRGR